LRVDVDARKESLSQRVAESAEQAIPWILIRGAREEADDRIVLRDRAGTQTNLPREEGIRQLLAGCGEPD